MVIETYSDNTGTIRWQGCGMFISPDGTAWSSRPYTKEQKRWKKDRDRDFIFSEKIIKFVEKFNLKLSYINKRIDDHTSTLSRETQKWFKEHYLDGISGKGRGYTILPDKSDK